MGKAAKQTQIDVFPSLLELAHFMMKDPSGIDRDNVRRGDELLGIFEDTTFKNSFKGLREQKMAALGNAARDISEGGELLRTSMIGVTFKEGKMAAFVTPHGSSPGGNIVFSVSWKQKRAFHNWRTDASNDNSQDDVNAALYRLAVCLSTIVIPGSK